MTFILYPKASDESLVEVIIHQRKTIVQLIVSSSDNRRKTAGATFLLFNLELFVPRAGFISARALKRKKTLSKLTITFPYLTVVLHIRITIM